MSAAPSNAAPARSMRKPGNRPIAMTKYVVAKMAMAAIIGATIIGASDVDRL